MRSRNCAWWCPLLLLAACVGEPDGTERAEGAATLGGAYLALDVRGTTGWIGTGFFNRGRVQVADPRRDLGERERTVTVSGIRHAIQIAGGSSVTLSVDSLKLGDVQPPLGTLNWLSMVLYHRPSGSRYAWQPMRCPSYFERTDFQGPLDQSFDLYQGPVTIDVGPSRTVRATIDNGPFLDPDFVTDTFERCGIKEALPEFAVMVVPAANAFYLGTPVNLNGGFPYQIRAACDGYWCWTYESEGRAPRASDESAGRDPAFLLESCKNGVDDDLDGRTDCADDECRGYVEWSGNPGEVRTGVRVCPE
jgi:hypothetical protein